VGGADAWRATGGCCSPWCRHRPKLLLPLPLLPLPLLPLPSVCLPLGGSDGAIAVTAPPLGFAPP
jgi:hypothetical protein